MPLGRVLFAFSLLVGACVALGQGGGGGQSSVKWSDVTQDQRDYSSNIQATDRAYRALSQNHPAVEYPASPSVTHVAYVRGNDVVVAARWKNTRSNSLSGTLTWQAARLAVPTTDGQTAYIDLTVDDTEHSVFLAANGGTWTKTLTLEDVPDYVAVGQIQIKYTMPLTDGEFTLNQGTDGNYYGWERLALVDSTPTGLQTVPWIDLLEFACRWAYGANGASDLREKMVKGMHLSSRSQNHKLNYNYTAQAAYYVAYQEQGVPLTSRTIDLTQFLTDLNGSASITRQCLDFAAILLLALQGNGRNASFEIVERYYTGNFWTWPLCPAGSDRTVQGSYSGYSFSFHAVVACDSLRLDSSSSYWYDPGGQVWKEPVWNWGIQAHWQQQVGNAFHGLAYGTSQSQNISLASYLRTNLQPDSVE